MKKNDIRIAYTQKVTELLNQGYTIYPDTMNGSQGEIAHIDLTNGSEILRVLLERDHVWERDEDGYMGDIIRLTVGRAAADTWVGDRWDGTIWNNRLEPIFQIEWAWLNDGRNDDWYVTMEEGRRVKAIRWERYKAKNGTQPYEDITDEAFKSACLRWLRKQPRMKTAKLEDIEHLRKYTRENGRRFYEITAKGRIYTLLKAGR